VVHLRRVQRRCQTTLQPSGRQAQAWSLRQNRFCLRRLELAPMRQIRRMAVQLQILRLVKQCYDVHRKSTVLHGKASEQNGCQSYDL
jgi:hypothetical protein